MARAQEREKTALAGAWEVWGGGVSRSAGRLHFFFSFLPLPVPLPLKLLRHPRARARDAARRHARDDDNHDRDHDHDCDRSEPERRSAARCSAVTRDGGCCGMAAAAERGDRAAVRVGVAIS